MPDSGDVALACTALLVDELARAGMRHACITPGSRSTPLALALERHPAVTVHVHIDERSSSYFALGIARATGLPVVAACSSGTAVANHLPAVVEASMARLPLIVLTADRPPELHDAGANQTIDQTRMFGVYTRWFADAGVPAEGEDAARYWRSLGARAAALALSPPPRPVHINLPYREPLVPEGATVSLGDATPGRQDGAPWHGAVSSQQPLDPADVAALRDVLGRAPRVAVVAGGTRRPAARLARLCADVGWPLLAEPASNIRRPHASLAAAELLVADAPFRDAHRADLVVRVGAAPTTRAMQAFVAQAGRLVVVDPDHIDLDPTRSAELSLRVDPDVLADALRHAGRPRPSDAWRKSWAGPDAAVRAGVDELLDAGDEPFEGRIARDVAAYAGDGGALFAGSSMPVRDLAVYMAPHETLRVLANRGASGIDGSVSSALGIAAVTQPAVALIGDLALLHDASALLWSTRGSARLTVVVIDNDGGGIFNLLPQASALPHEEFERLFGTPHGSGVDLESFARAAGAGYQRVTAAHELHAAMASTRSATGVQLIHVIVDRARSAVQRAAVSDRVRAVLAAG